MILFRKRFQNRIKKDLIKAYQKHLDNSFTPLNSFYYRSGASDLLREICKTYDIKLCEVVAACSEKPVISGVEIKN